MGNRFLSNKIFQNRGYCSLNNGIKIKMELSFLANFASEDYLAEIASIADILIMTKNRSVKFLQLFPALSAMQIHTVLQNYQPTRSQVGSRSVEANIAVVPKGMSQSSREIVEKLERQQKAK